MPKKILIADDDNGILDALKLILEESDYEVEVTENGKDLLKLNDQLPDLILLDIWMSGIDGKVVCQHLKNNPSTLNIPIIMISANRDTAHIAKEAGADDYILKPFDMEELLDKIDRHLVAEN